jgi:hypothetical protein
MPTIIAGDAATAATLGITSSRRKIEMEDRVHLLEPSVNPLAILLRQVGKESVANPKFEWLESEATPITDRINNSGGYTAGATSVVVDNGAYVPVSSLIKVQRTGEVMLVTAVSTNTLTVTRSFGGTAAAALLDNDQITMLGGVAVENDDSEASREVQKTGKFNYTQISRSPFGASGTLQASDLYGGDYLSQEARERLIEHDKYIEMALWFGERAEVTSGNTPRRSTGGIDEWISTNSKNFGGALTLEEMFEAGETAFRYGSDNRMLFCGLAACSNVSLIAEPHLEAVSPASTFGIKIQRLVTPHGVWNITPHKLFEGDTYSLQGYSVDLANLKYVYLRGRDTALYTNIQDNDVDGQKNEYLTEFGLKRKLEKTAMKFTNMAV